jgi:hypothetical protein
MKRISIYFIGLIFLVMALGNPAFIFAAKEISTMMCHRGVVKIGDTDVDVRDKCGEPNNETADNWVYEPSVSQTFTVIFKGGKVLRILEKR